MSIDEVIDWQVEAGRLFPVTPRAAGTRKIRALFVTKELNALLNGPWEDVDDEIRFSLLRADLEVFVEGRLIGPKYLYWLTPRTDLVWEIRSLEPDPSIRVLGMFARMDVLILTTWCRRSDLKGWNSKEWRDARERCKAIWKQLFVNYQPLGGSQIHDFVSNAAPGQYFKI